ncbi:ornithine cyclodeaminase family protein [Actinomadura sp. 9N407]|uniref:ornithine cyclodeaminase family protein n=1 Tax=Actinomadura sp. 9N407 TaxID=3375154 RepID=UPI00379758D3
MIGAAEIRRAVSMAEAIAAVRSAFLDTAAGRFEQPPRTVLDDGGFLIMPIHHRPTGTLAVKTLRLDFGRTDAEVTGVGGTGVEGTDAEGADAESGGAAITGSILWSDRRPEPLMFDAGPVTALRTGAATGVATDLLAAPGASRLVLIGAGAQAADQVRGVHAVRPLRELTIVGTGSERAALLAEILAGELPGTEIRVTRDAAKAVAGADIVCCATPATEPLFPASALPERVHVNAIGSYRPSMQELPGELLSAAALVVDDREAVLAEAGEIIQAVRSGEIGTGDLIPLGEALGRSVPPAAAWTVYKSVGTAAQDWALARLLAEKLG